MKGDFGTKVVEKSRLTLSKIAKRNISLEDSINNQRLLILNPSESTENTMNGPSKVRALGRATSAYQNG